MFSTATAAFREAMLSAAAAVTLSAMLVGAAVVPAQTAAAAPAHEVRS